MRGGGEDTREPVVEIPPLDVARRVQLFGVWGPGFRVWTLGFEVWGWEFGAWSLRFGVWGKGCGLRSFVFAVSRLELGVHSLGFRVSAFSATLRDGVLELCSGRLATDTTKQWQRLSTRR